MSSRRECACAGVGEGSKGGNSERTCPSNVVLISARCRPHGVPSFFLVMRAYEMKTSLSGSRRAKASRIGALRVRSAANC